MALSHTRMKGILFILLLTSAEGISVAENIKLSKIGASLGALGVAFYFGTVPLKGRRTNPQSTGQDQGLEAGIGARPGKQKTRATHLHPDMAGTDFSAEDNTTVGLSSAFIHESGFQSAFLNESASLKELLTLLQTEQHLDRDLSGLAGEKKYWKTPVCPSDGDYTDPAFLNQHLQNYYWKVKRFLFIAWVIRQPTYRTKIVKPLRYTEFKDRMAALKSCAEVIDCLPDNHPYKKAVDLIGKLREASPCCGEPDIGEDVIYASYDMTQSDEMFSHLENEDNFGQGGFSQISETAVHWFLTGAKDQPGMKKAIAPEKAWCRYRTDWAVPPAMDPDPFDVPYTGHNGACDKKSILSGKLTAKQWLLQKNQLVKDVSRAMRDYKKGKNGDMKALEDLNNEASTKEGELTDAQRNMRNQDPKEYESLIEWNGRLLSLNKVNLDNLAKFGNSSLVELDEATLSELGFLTQSESEAVFVFLVGCICAAIIISLLIAVLITNIINMVKKTASGAIENGAVDNVALDNVAQKGNPIRKGAPACLAKKNTGQLVKIEDKLEAMDKKLTRIADIAEKLEEKT